MTAELDGERTAAADPERLLDGLDEGQRSAATTLLGPVCILAGAGTGKTRAITHRIAYGVATGAYTPERVLALTFTTRAAGELRTRLRGLGARGVQARTFHAAALAQLGYFWPTVVGGPAPRVLPAKAAVLGEAADRLKLRLDTAALRDVAGEIEWRKVSGLTPGEYERAARTRELPAGLGATAMVELHAAYERVKDERRQIDFEDVLLATAGMLETEPAVADEVRGQYRFFVVDEYQDVSPLQQRLLDLWLGRRTDLCVVGDASQTIYSFAGASADHLLGFAARYDDAHVVRLEQNHRSAQPVLDAANRLMRGRPGALELQRADGAPGDTVAPVIEHYGNDAAEAEAVAESVAAELRAGLRPERIAVLFRVNAQAPALAQALATRGIATRPLAGAKFFDHPAVKQAMLLFGSVGQTDSGRQLFQSVSDVLHSMGWTSAPPSGGPAERERWELLTALVELADTAPPGTGLKRFAVELEERRAAQHEPSLAAVTLGTLHAAKGLEWDSVHIVGVAEGLLPVSYARSLDEIAEERRLLYVGITRARRRLALTSAERHGSAPEGAGRRREPSRFLDELRTRTPDAGRPPAR